MQIFKRSVALYRLYNSSRFFVTKFRLIPVQKSMSYISMVQVVI